MRSWTRWSRTFDVHPRITPVGYCATDRQAGRRMAATQRENDTILLNGSGAQGQTEWRGRQHMESEIARSEHVVQVMQEKCDSHPALLGSRACRTRPNNLFLTERRTILTASDRRTRCKMSDPVGESEADCTGEGDALAVVKHAGKQASAEAVYKRCGVRPGQDFYGPVHEPARSFASGKERRRKCV